MIRRAAATLALALFCPGIEANAQGVPALPPTLLDRLNGWLDTHSEYAKPDQAPVIRLITQDEAALLHGVTDRSGGRIRGLYDASAATIYLTEPWSPDNPDDIGVLLHELVHHRQAGWHWYCEQAQEWRAYQIQADWLGAHGLDDGFYWPAILLQSSCAKRDIHPP